MEFDTTMRHLERCGWKTPNAYDNAFGVIPPNPGIYLFLVFPSPVGLEPPRIGYIGKSRNLAQRIQGHPVLTRIDRELNGAYIQRWFLLYPESEIDQAERVAIRKYSPALNVQHIARTLNVA